MSSASSVLHRPPAKRPASPWRGALRIAVIYFAFAVAWVPLANFFFGRFV